MKNIVFFLSLCAIGLTFVFRNATRLSLCEIRDVVCKTTYNTLEISFYIFALVFLFSVITYKAPERIFTAWWNFARFAAPSIFIGSVVVSLGYFNSPGGFFNMDDTVDQVLLVGMYLIFSIGSVVQIIRGYRKK